MPTRPSSSPRCSDLGGPAYWMAAENHGGYDAVLDDPAVLLDFVRQAVEIGDKAAAWCAELGHTIGEVIDITRAVDDAEAKVEAKEDGRRSGPPYSPLGRYEVGRLYGRGMLPPQLDILFGFPAGTSSGCIAEHPPPKNVRVIFRGHREGQTAMRMARTLGMAPQTVRDTLGFLRLVPNEAPDRRLARDFRPKVVRLAAEHIAHRGEPNVALIIEVLARDGFDLTSTQVRNAIRAARKAGTLPPARRRDTHGPV